MSVGKSWSVLGALVVLLVSSSAASAQGWLADRARTEGAGVRVGDFELHPGVGSEVGYDSNVFLSDQPQSSAVLRIAPHFYISTLGPQRADGAPRKLTLRAGINGSVRHWFATQQKPNVGVGQLVDLTWRPGGVFSLNLNQQLTRTVEPFADPGAPTTGITDSNVNFARDRLGVGARAQLATRSEVLRGGLGYRLELDHFENDAFSENRNSAHTITTDTSWEFLPKTALFWDGSLALRNFVGAPGDASTGALTVRNDSKGVSSRLGLNGALTSTLGFSLAAGYSAQFFSDDNDTENVVALAEARWQPRENLRWTLGYDRSITPAFQGNFTNMNRFRTAVQSTFGGTLLLTARAEVTLLDYGFDPIQGDRSDTHLLGGVEGEYRFTDWLGLTAELTYWNNITDFVFESGVGAAAVSDAAEFERFQAWLGLRAFL